MTATRRVPTARLACLIVAGCVALAGCTGTMSAEKQSSLPGPASPSGTASAPTTGATGGGLPSVPNIVTKVEPSVVTITTPIGLGSGVVYKSDGTIVTDAHVVEDQQKQPFQNVQVQFADGSQVKASVVGVDDVTDVAVIKADRDNLPAATFSTSQPVVGQMTVVIGSPLGLVETVTAGIVSGLHRNMPPSDESPQGLINLIQTDAPISPGNSGGAVANGKAEVIGLSEAYLPPSSGAVAIGFVTPAGTVTDVADQLLKNGTVKHAFMGLVPTEISQQVAERFNLSTTSGALIIQVVEGGPAAQAGIKAGDIITKIGGDKVSSVVDLLAALRKDDPGQKVKVEIQRGSNSKTVTVTLSNRPGQ